MKILFLARRFYPYIGGVEKHVMEVSKMLISQGHSVSIITEMPEDNEYDLFEEINKIAIYRIKVGAANRLQKFRIWRQISLLRDVVEKSDIVHCHDVFFWYLPFRFMYPQKPVYMTFHGYEGYPISKKAIQVRKLSEKLVWGNICIGDFIPKWYGTKPTYVSYGAVRVDAADGGEQRVKNVKRESALFFGRLDDQTGILTYEKAIKKLQKKYPKFDFLVIGDGKYKKELDKNIQVLPFLQSPEKYFIKYHFAFLSRYLSILEAFAAKRLVVAVYDNPVKEDYLKMTPYAKWIIIENTPEGVVARIDDMLHNSKKEEKMINAAYAWVQKQTWEKMCQTYLLLWKQK
jgi:glycosyltransferase involved in cell wall biosynthesis